MARNFTRNMTLQTLSAAVALAVSGAVFAGQANLATLGGEQSYSRFIVKYADNAPESSDSRKLQDALVRASQRADSIMQGAQIESTSKRRGKPLAVNHLHRISVGGDVIKSSRDLSSIEAEVLMQEIAAMPGVEFVEVDQLMKPLFTPNDTSYTSQWHYYEATGGLNLPTAWDKATGTGVVVAVLDTGITAHTDLNANVIAGYDFISDAASARDGNGRDSNPNDQGDWTTAGQCGTGSPASNSSWHGTHVAGTVAAVTNNAKGVAGVAYNAKIMPVRVLGACGGYTSDIADGIIWASGGTVTGIANTTTPAKVINMSLGGGGTCSSTYQNAINGAVGRGTTVVVAAGNSNANVSGSVPANCTGVVAVASNDREGNRASYSNYGTLIDVTAPGGETAVSGNGVASTLNTGTTVPSAETYAYYQGTSMAAPHVAGVVALMQSVASKTPADIESLLKSTARALPGSCSGGCGSGIVDANAAVVAAMGTPPPPPPPTGGALTNGVPKTGLSGATGSQTFYTLVVPAGASNLQFVMSGGTGDADMYVKFGSAPTTSVYDCRPYLSGNNETCTIATAQAGTYHVMLNGYAAYSGVSLTGSYSVGSPVFTNTADVTISDLTTVYSNITVSGQSGNASASTKVDVHIIHTYKGDLRVDVVGPSGTIYNIHNRSGGSADNIIGTFYINASAQTKNGLWRLKVYDAASGDVGYIDSWSIQF